MVAVTVLSATEGKRRMDLDRLSDGEKIAGVSAIALFIFMFFEWFSVDVSTGSGSLSVSASGSGSAWDALDNIPIFLVITIIAALAVVALRLTDADYEPPVSANAVVAVLGIISALLILFRIVDPPGAGSIPGISVDVSPAFGIFLSLIAAAGIGYGSYRAMQAEGNSFSDFGDRVRGGGSPPPPPSGGTPAPAPDIQAPSPPPASPTAPPPPPPASPPPPPPSGP
jgi:uncharacterized membrane protein YhaH (DUF805 family)